MGTINIKGHRKLPPSPLCMNEDEIEKFGLEECEAEEPEEESEEIDGVILDEGVEPEVDPELEQTVQNVYLGLRVGDMVKITAKNKFFNEDAVVRRLKNRKLFLRFFTYGSMYEEWMDPGDVRKLTDVEVLKGLSGPQQPITQRDIDGPSRGEDRGRYQDDRSRRNMVDNFGGDQKRRQGRNAERYSNDNGEEAKRNDDNWRSYKDNQRRQQGGYDDGGLEMQGSKKPQQRRPGVSSDQWAPSDVDGQWGRTSQRQNRREKRMTSSDEGDDWSAFVSSPSGKNQPSQQETDDFFASLMTDLSNDFGSDRKTNNDGNSNKQGMKTNTRTPTEYSTGEDDFFASLISEIENDTPVAPTTAKNNNNRNKKVNTNNIPDDDDFFASLAAELYDDDDNIKMRDDNDVGLQRTKSRTGHSDVKREEDDLLATLEMVVPKEPTKTKKPSNSKTDRRTSNEMDDLDSFFSEIGMLNNVDDDSSSSASSSSSSSKASSSSSSSRRLELEEDDFFSQLQTGLDSQIHDDDDDFGHSARYSSSSKRSSSSSSSSGTTSTPLEDVDFFTQLEAELDSQLYSTTSSSTSSPPPKKQRQKEQDTTTSTNSKTTTTTTTPLVVKNLPENDVIVSSASKTKKTKTKDTTTTTTPTVGLEDRTMPELKEMLRERGLKISGKKSELIERLTSA